MGADGGTTVTGAQPPGAPELDNAGAFVAAAGLRLTHVAGDRVEGAADRGQIAVGTNNNTDFLRSMTTGTVAVTAAPLHQGRTQQLWEVRITDQSGRLVARGTVRLQNIQPRQ